LPKNAIKKQHPRNTAMPSSIVSQPFSVDNVLKTRLLDAETGTSFGSKESAHRIEKLLENAAPSSWDGKLGMVLRAIEQLRCATETSIRASAR
jgi:hypothetical protein